MDNKEIAIVAVSHVTGISKSRILSSSREWPLVEARQLITLVLSKVGYTDESIGLALNRKRPTVLKSRHRAEGYMAVSALFREKFDKAYSRYEHEKSLRVS